MKLYGSLTSPYVRKARVLIEEKSLPVELVVEDPWEEGTAIAGWNPLGKVPVLEVGPGSYLFDSDARDALSRPPRRQAAGAEGRRRLLAVAVVAGAGQRHHRRGGRARARNAAAAPDAVAGEDGARGAARAPRDRRRGARDARADASWSGETSRWPTSCWASRCSTPISAIRTTGAPGRRRSPAGTRASTKREVVQGRRCRPSSARAGGRMHGSDSVHRRWTLRRPRRGRQSSDLRSAAGRLSGMAVMPTAFMNRSCGQQDVLEIDLGQHGVPAASRISVWMRNGSRGVAASRVTSADSASSAPSRAGR